MGMQIDQSRRQEVVIKHDLIARRIALARFAAGEDGDDSAIFDRKCVVLENHSFGLDGNDPARVNDLIDGLHGVLARHAVNLDGNVGRAALLDAAARTVGDIADAVGFDAFSGDASRDEELTNLFSLELGAFWCFCGRDLDAYQFDAPAIVARTEHGSSQRDASVWTEAAAA